MDAVQRWLTLLTLVSAALAGLIYLGRQTWRGFKVVEKLASVVEHELSPNTGSSMKDDVAAIAVAVGQVQRDVADLTESKETAHGLLQLQLDSLTDEVARHHPPAEQHPTHRREADRQ